jgi:glycolate oxidase FAD binding subunit
MNNNTAIYKEFRERILSAAAKGTPLVIQGGGSKNFYGRTGEGEIIDTRPCAGIISYEPSELVLTAHAGTPLSEVVTALAARKQMLAFEPPAYTDATTLGGMVACGLSGPRRPWSGSVRDYVLGVACINGKGEMMKFGGQVMKNVAGYDVSRLMTGAMGTLGLLLEISIKVQPAPECEISLCGSMDFNTALQAMNAWAGKALSLSAASYDGAQLYVRLSGKSSAVTAARKKFELADADRGYWQRSRDHQLPFFQDSDRPLWRISVPATTPALALSGRWLVEWGGAQRWLQTVETAEKIRHITHQAHGHATLFRGGDRDGDVFHPLATGIRELHVRLKQAFDPGRILNRGRMYRDL